ncbi:IgGFc-binding protein [Paraglaciecola sp. Hal342]
MASEDNTSVEINGIFQGTINRGEFIETPLLTGNLSFSGDNPIFVTQYMPGQSSPGATLGDPAMGNMIPSEQYLTDYTFSTVGDSQFVQNFATIIAANADVGSLLLDGVPVPAGDFTPFDDIPFSSAVIELTQGTHTTSSLNPHGITVEGYNGFDSYIYPGGALFGFINSQGDPFPPVCSVTMNGDMASGSVSDNTNDEDLNNNGQLDPGEDANNNGVLDADTGVFFVNTLSSTNVSISVSPFAAGDGSVSVSATRIDGSQPGSASIEGVDGAGNTCALEIEFTDEEAMACDIDGDMNVDMDDLMMIRAARNMSALPGDLRDNDGNGVINTLDFRQCTIQCTQNRCAVL